MNSPDTLPGSQEGVFAFLEDCLGCRWWTSKASTIPANPTVNIPFLDIRYVPPIEYRYSFWTDAFDPHWAVRNRSNGPDGLNRPEFGGQITHGGVHTFYPLIPPERYFGDHPEWFSLIDGKRSHDRAQLCLTNTDLRKELITNLKERIRRSPAQHVFSVSQNDWHGNCQCADCKALDDAAGSPAGSLLYFVNTVADEIGPPWTSAVTPSSLPHRTKRQSL